MIHPIKENHYDAVSHLLPSEDTADIMYRILQPLAEHELLRDLNFRCTLRNLKASQAQARAQLEEAKLKQQLQQSEKEELKS